MTLSKKWLALLIVAVLLGVSAPITAQDITETPSPEPTLIEPTATPTDMPTLEPTVAPTEVATDIPTELPTEQPTLETPVEVTDEATIEPTEEATTEVTEVATETPVATIGVEETPVVEPTLSVTEVDPEPALQLLERELFDNLPDAAVWSIPASASLTEGQVGQGLQLAADENTSTESLALITPYQDVVVQADFKLQSGEARLNTRANDTTSYSAGLSADAVTLYQGSEILLSTPLTLDLSLWHTLRLSTIGNVVRVSVDDVEWIVARQNTSLESGTASISGTETGNLLVDNIFVWIPESVIETTPMTVTPEATQTDEIVAQTTNQGAMLFNTTYSRSMSADGHRWTWYFDQTYPNWLLDIQPTSGNLRYQIVLVGPSGTYSTRSSDNGRGILWRPPSTTAGNYYVDLIPYAGYSSGNYNITIWSCCKPKIRADWGTQYGWSTTNQWYIENTSSGQQYIRMQVEPGYSMTYNWSLYGATDSATPNGAIYATGNGASNLTIVPISLPAGGYHFNFNVVSGGGSYMIGLYSGAPYTSVPGSFSVGSLNTTGGTLTWTDTSGNEDGYRVYRRTPGNGWGNPIATLGANATSYNDTTATCGAQYEYMVSSYNWNGQANSAGQTVTIPFCPPVNDNRANAEIISTFTTLVGRSPNGATTEGVDANLCAAVTHTIWYRFTPTTSGPITINTVGSNYDTVLAVFLAGDNYYQVCNDDANPPNQSSSLWLDVQAGQTYEIVVGKYGSNATTTGHSLTLDVRTPPAVSTPVVLRSPAAGSFSMYPNVVLAIVPNAACSMFEFQLSTAANFTSILDQWVYAPDPNNINATAALNDGLYFWRARCRGLTGGAGPWSAGRSFTVDTVATGSPTLTAPLDGSIQPSLRPTAKWDVVPGSNRYSVEIATDADFINTLSFPTTMVETTATTFVLPPLPGQGQFWVRVYAKDAAGNWSAPSAARTFTANIQSTPLDNGFISTTATVSVARPKFTWAATTGATGYQVTVAADPDFSFLMYQSPVLGSTVTNHTIPATDAGLNWGTYYWRVDIIGKPNVSPVYRLLNVSPPLPTAPVCTIPTVTSVPVLSWTTPNYAYTGLTFHVQIDNNSNFVSPEIDDTAVGASPYPPILADGVWYARVQAVNDYMGTGGWCAVRTFTVDTVAPDAPIATTPASNTSVSTVRPSLNSTVPTGAVRRYLDMDVNPDFINGLYTDITVSGAAAYTIPAAQSPLTQGQWYVRWQSEDAAGNRSAEGPVSSFYVNLTTAPANRFNYVTATTVKPAFAWAASGIGGIYTVELSTDADFNSVFWSTTTSALSVPAAQAPVLGYGQYWWRVRDAYGNPPYNPFSFSVTPNVPAAPVVTSPPNATAVPFSGFITMTYNLVVTAVNYEYQCIQTATNAIFDSATTSMTEFQMLGFGSDGAFKCQVRAINQYGAAGPWTVRNFIKDTVAPTAPVITTPTQNQKVTLSKPTIAVTAVPTAVRYNWTLSQNADLSNAWTWQTTTVSGTSPALLPASTWYLQVTAQDSAGNVSNPSALRVFSITSAVPQLNRFGGTNATLSWTPINWATAFEVQVSTITTFTGTLSYSSNSISGTGTQVVTSTLRSGVYYWRVRARKADGMSWSAWSTTKTIVVEG